MRFGLGVPTGTEGLMYPVPYADIDDAVRLALAAEALGFDSVWANDHVTTQAYVRQEFPDPPRYYDPFAYLSYVAAVTERLRLATAIMVLPFRHPVVAAKQAATLDQLSRGRALLGVGIGAYREEFESMWPGHTLHRGQHAEETVRALRLLFEERRATFEGRWVSFNDVESYPKPVQRPLPILSGGNAVGSRHRAARLGDGWLPACLTPNEVAQGLVDIDQVAAADGRARSPSFDVALQVGVSLGRTHEEAERRFQESQLHAHLVSLSGSTLKGRDLGGLAERNLIGTPDEVAEQVARYAEAGVTTLAGLLFAVNTVEETIEAMEEFSELIIGGSQSRPVSVEEAEVRADA